MFSLCYAFLAVSLLNSLHDFHVSSCDENCAYKPVFTPSRLVVKFGDPASATCLACQHTCPNNLYGLENSVGVRTINGTTISWEVDSLTEWDTSPMCYYTGDDNNQCCSTLPITVYQPPKNASFSFLNHFGSMTAGHQHTLQCHVQEVAPVANLSVTFYRGQTELGQRKVKGNLEKKPVTETFTLDITPSKEDDGGQYWCEAKLDLGAEGPQTPPVVESGKLTATVYYGPQRKGSSHPDLITVTEGDRLQLNCSAVGNPSPSYNWTLPSATGSPFSGDILTIESVTLEHKGQYTCSVHNYIGTVTVKFNVDVKENYMYIILVVLSVIVLATIVFISVYIHLYKQSRKGRYDLKDVFRLPSQFIALPTGESICG